MKKNIFLFIIFSLLFFTWNVSAKDVVYSLHKYPNEEFTHIIKSYNETDISDGILVGGKILQREKKEESFIEKTSLLLVNYKKNGNIIWTYTYEEKELEELIGLHYSYNEENKIDGYLVTIKTKEVQEDENIYQTVFLKISLAGELLEEKTVGIEYIELIKILPITRENEIGGYLAIGTKQEESYVIFYDKDQKIIWTQTFTEKVLDITPSYEENNLEKIILLAEEKEEKKLIEITPDGNNKKVLEDHLNSYENIFLSSTENGFLLYGTTKEVKLKKGENSYFVLSYDNQSNLLWESIGEIPVDDQYKMKLFYNQGTYFLLYKNAYDKSYEVSTLNMDGIYQKKIKKLHNDYYEFIDFFPSENTLYFIGKIHCLEDEICSYQESSLLLISDEDKVIELEESNNTNAIILLIIFIGILLFTFVYTRKRRKLQ